jgi:hypothetical protein
MAELPRAVGQTLSRVLACADVYDATHGAAFFPKPFAALCAHVDAQPLAA